MMVNMCHNGGYNFVGGYNGKYPFCDTDKFSPQQQWVIDDEENPLKYIIGEAGSGKTHVCMAIVKKYLDKMNYHKIFYVIAEHKKAFLEFVKEKLKSLFQIDAKNDGNSNWNCLEIHI